MPIKKTWIIPLASTLPALAIVYAFSLGPSPRKLVHDFYQGTRSPIELAAQSERIIPVLLEDLARPGAPRRPEVLSFLGQVKARQAIRPLESIVASDLEAADARGRALLALARIDLGSAMPHAERYRADPTALGEAARKVSGTPRATPDNARATSL